MFISFVVLDKVWKYFPPIEKWYYKQSRDIQLGWNGTSIAVLHACVASTSAVRAVFFEKELDFYNLFSNSPITEWQLGFTGGYFLNDILILIIQKNAENRMGFIGHHMFSLFGCALGLKNLCGMWFCAFRLLTELSNPFMNIRILLDMMGVKKNSYIARLNGKFFLSSFVLTRPPMIPAFWGATIYHLVKNSNQFWQFDAPSLFFWIVSGLALDYLNVIWLIKIRKESAEYLRED